MLVGYARVSSLEQARDSSALEQQQERLRKAGCTRIYTDIQSGTRDDRPQLKAALAALTPADTLIATRLDRITRSPRFNEQLLNRFSADGAPGLRLLDDGIDVNTVTGRLTARLLAAVSAGEVERLSERVAHGRAHRQSKGGHGAKPPWGFRRAPDGLGLVVDPELEPITRSVIEHFIQGRSIRATSSWLSDTHGIAKGKSSLRRWLMNPCLAGGIGRASGTTVKRPDGTTYRQPPEPGRYHHIEWEQHQGLINRAQWAELQRAFQISADRGGGAHHAAVIRQWHSGRFRCEGCGSRMRPHHQRIRCDAAQCPKRHGNGSIHRELGKASLLRALEWFGSELAHQLAPLRAAAESTAAVEPAELLQLRSDLHQLQTMAIPGTEAVIADKQSQITAMTAQLHGTTISAALVLERLLPLLSRPWQMNDDELLQVLDDAEIVAEIQSHWVVTVRSDRFGCSWQFNPATKREQFNINVDQPLATAMDVRLGLQQSVALHRTAAWWGAVDDEIDRQSD